MSPDVCAAEAKEARSAGVDGNNRESAARAVMSERGPSSTGWARRIATGVATVAFIAGVVLIIASITSV